MKHKTVDSLTQTMSPSDHDDPSGFIQSALGFKMRATHVRNMPDLANNAQHTDM